MKNSFVNMYIFFNYAYFYIILLQEKEEFELISLKHAEIYFPLYSNYGIELSYQIKLQTNARFTNIRVLI